MKTVAILMEHGEQSVDTGDVMSEALVDHLPAGVIDNAYLMMRAAPVDRCESVLVGHDDPV